VVPVATVSGQEAKPAFKSVESIRDSSVITAAAAPKGHMPDKNDRSGMILGMAFSILIALLIGIGYLGLSRINRISTDLNQLLGRQWTTVQLSREALVYSDRNSRITMELFLVNDAREIDRLRKIRAENTDRISELVRQLQGLCNAPEDLRLLAGVKAARTPYVASYLRAMHLLLDEHDYQAASAVMLRETTPAINEYRAAWNNFIQAQMQEMDKAMAESRARYAAASALVFMLVVLAVSIATLTAVFATRKMMADARTRVLAEQSVRELNATLEQRVEERTADLLQATQQLSSEIAARESARRQLHLQAAALEAAANSIAITDVGGSILWVNPAFTRLTGYEVEEARGQNPRILKSGKQPPAFYANLWKTITAGDVWHGELTNLRKDGSLYDEEMTITPVRSDSGEVSFFVAIKQDITARRASQAALLRAEEQYRTIFENAVVGIFQVTLEGRLILANPALARMHGYDSPEQLRAEVSDVHQLLVNPLQLREMSQELEEKGIARDFEMEVYCKDGSKKWFLENLCAVRGADGKVVRQDGTVQDITLRKAAEQQVRFLAYYDALTGLPNRLLFQDRLEKALAGAQRRGEKVALLFLDLDRFKMINDSLGHSVGDLLLKQVADRLKKCTRDQDTVARLGGDEFVIVLSGLQDESDAAVAADRFRTALAGEFLVQEHSLSVSCSIGIGVYPNHAADAETLVKNADTAMYCAKENGKNNFRFFTPDMNSAAVERLILDNSLRLALEKDELFLEYQPQLNLTTGKIIGAEALLRWRHPELGLIPPVKFIPLAENNGMIIPIGEWVLRTACAQARQWQEEGFDPLPVAVNVSAVQFRQERFFQVIRSVLEETGLAPQYLELELTESLLLSTADVMLCMLQQLEGTGVRLSIDDFGTGYSSLSYLRRLPVYKLKIDRAFVQDLHGNPDDAAITATIINMAKSLNLKVLAEGVETVEQVQFLQGHGCDEVQGFYFSRPVGAGEFADKLRANRPWALIPMAEVVRETPSPEIGL
jgi:diguanylate cyclase (GGDEF)-like protein/PAS domain S-box-containing protein